MDSHTKKSTRIIIWVIAIVMAAGFLGSYFLVILENNNNSKQSTANTADSKSKEKTEVDPTAYKVTGAVEALQTTDETVGTGDEAHAGDTVKVHYKGTIAQSGVKFDSSYDRGEPIDISLGKVIQGWQEGIPGMKIGGKRRLVVPAAMAYGEQPPQGSNIPANSDLVFEVELLGVTPAAAQQ